MSELCLVSTSGDMSCRGMGTKNTIYLFPYKYKKEVDNFFKAQCDWDLIIYDERFGKKGFNSQKHYRKLSDTFDILQDLNVFTCKYDFRTNWTMRFFNEDELKQFEPYIVHDNFNLLKKKDMKLKKLTKKTVCNWFGDRGYDLNSAKFNYKAIYDPNNDNDWIFINVMKANNYYTDESFDKKEVELFYLNTDIAEPYNSWNKKSFKWNKKNLVSLIPKEDNDKWYEKFNKLND